MASRNVLIALVICLLGFEASLSMNEEMCPKCHNGGNCTVNNNVYSCSCADGFYGMRCEKCDDRDCGMGTCAMYMNMTTCLCPGGYMMPNCSMGCSDSPCKNGGTCMMDMSGNLQCKNCMDGYMGKFCDIKSNMTVECNSTACSENGTDICTSTPEGEIMCHCKNMFVGKMCEAILCQVHECKYGKCNTTYNLAEDECMCMKGWTGQHCEKMDPCYNVTCENNGTCYNDSGEFRCMCKPGWEGMSCEVTTMPTTMMTTMEPLPQACLDKGCDTKAMNQQCDLDCSVAVCRFDNYDCTGGRKPWIDCNRDCGTVDKFGNNVCDDDCNNEMCLFDAFDCATQQDCPPEHNCSVVFDNGVCDTECNSSACAYDGLDCDNDKGKWLPEKNILGSLRVRFKSMLSAKELAYRLSLRLNVVLYVQPADSKTPMSMTMPNNDEKEAVFEVDVRHKCGMNTGCWTKIENLANAFSAITLKEYWTPKPEFEILSVTDMVECAPGFFGMDCTRVCSTNCLNDKCDKMTGRCTMNCEAGFRGYNCTEACPKGSYGEDCSYTCQNCKNMDCDRFTGHCQSGCIRGYTDPLCSSKCPGGKYGDGCSMTCSSNCMDQSKCNYMTGECPCKAGYKGTKCNTECGDGEYGRDCQHLCSRHCEENKCNSMTGHCLEGCKKGYEGNKCMKECSTGTYGKNCSMTCSKFCYKDECDPVSGKCDDCKEGYEGDMCQSNPADRKQDRDQDKDKETDNTGIIAGIIVLVILIIVALIIAFFLWKRSQAGEYDMDEKTSPNERPIPMDQMEIENELIAVNNVSTTDLIPKDENKETTTSASESEPKGVVAENNTTDEDKPLLKSERSEPEGKESSIDRESRDLKTSSVYTPPTDGEGGPGGVYVGPGKDAVAGETVEDKGGSNVDQAPDNTQPSETENETKDDTQQSEGEKDTNDEDLPPPPPEVEDTSPPEEITDNKTSPDTPNDTKNEEESNKQEPETATEDDKQNPESGSGQQTNTENDT